MHSAALLIPALILIPIALAAAGYAILALSRIAAAVRAAPTARAGLALPEPESGWPAVRIIIPAHNEAAVIGLLVESLLRLDYPRFSVIFGCDRCTDDTAAIIRGLIGADPRFEVVEISRCPDDWAGKCHALHRGVTHSRADAAPAMGGDPSAGRPSGGELLLFADADTIFDPACLRATVALLFHRRLDMLSLLSTLTARRWWELLVQPAASLELMRHFPIARINRDDRRRAFANGQFMLFRREAYDRIGGHEAVRHELLEDLAFARRLKAAKLRVGVLLADRMLACRMYGSWADFRRGWKRIYTESAQRRPRRLQRWSWQLIVSGVVLPLGALACAALGAVAVAGERSWAAWAALIAGALGLAMWLIAMAAVHRLQRAPLWTTLAHPLGAWMTASLIREAASDLTSGRATQWAGRAYTRAAR